MKRTGIEKAAKEMRVLIANRRFPWIGFGLLLFFCVVVVVRPDSSAFAKALAMVSMLVIGMGVMKRYGGEIGEQFE